MKLKIDMNTYRGANCLLVTFYSLHCMLKYKKKLLDPSFKFSEFYYLNSYIVLYMLYDMINIFKTKRVDLFLHHVMGLANCYFYANGLTTIVAFNEIITIAYLLPQQYQKIYRILCILFVRIPIWTTYYVTDYYFTPHFSLIHNYLLTFTFMFTILLDTYWLKQNLK